MIQPLAMIQMPPYSHVAYVCISLQATLVLFLAGLCFTGRAFSGETPNLGGATFVPLDSWLYPALTRVAALGFIPDQNTGLQPWTRAECARQVAEAERLLGTNPTPAASQARTLLAGLETEFPPDLPQHDKVLALESVYTGFTGIAGTPLTDSYHFGQTISNDYGRPYASGLSNFTGISGFAGYGHFFAYARGEYEYAPGVPGYTLPVRQFIAAADANPLQPAAPGHATSRFQLLDTYVGAQAGFELVTFGSQSFWWGPGGASAFSLSNNAAPFYTLNFSQSRPLVLPGVLRYMGEMHTQFLFGELEGHNWPRRPLMNAQKVSFDVTPDLEVGFVRSAFWGGVGHPETLGGFWNDLASTASTGTTFVYGDRADPGDRHAGFDFRYRIPGLHHYVTLYSDSYADDDPSPLANPSRSAWAPGIYISRLPGLPRLDLRAETYSTWLYAGDEGGTFIYWNNEYHDAYTNSGNLLGSWIGRDARAYVASAGYWLTGRTRFQAEYRQVKDSPLFLPGGGTQTDGSLYVQWDLQRKWLVSGLLQVERYDIPVLGSPRDNTTARLTITYTPHLEASR